MVIALSVSHIRAEAEAAGVSLSEGFFQRLERYVAMMIGLPVPGALLPGARDPDGARRPHGPAARMDRARARPGQDGIA